MKSNKLKRNINLVSATSIGLGAMLGAGIFVFPGLAGGDAGFAAIISFLIGGLIALSVAACTAELASAMPNSGGGYYFISRSFGPFWGTLVGVSQWLGLVFACAFYLVSFGRYAFSILDELNISWSYSKTILSFLFTLFLLCLNLIGTKKVGQFQNFMVIGLTIILFLIFSYGLLDLLGFENKSLAFNKIAPKGTLSIFTTTALIFTSYLGFVQIANIGAEVKFPSKNLPKSLMWSVIMAMVLYSFIMFVCIATFSQEELKAFGELATIEVARNILGKWGAIVVLFAALLATLSSANASMISASRGIFAISKDQLINRKASVLNNKFGTPHIALILVAIPVALMLFLGKLKIFAEVASFLHLIIYAGICMSLLKLRNNNPIWYVPTFRVPSFKLIAGLGALSCVVLLCFMQKASILIGLAVLSLSACYYLIRIRKKGLTLDSPRPPHIDADMISPKILIPVNITKENKHLPKAILEAIPISKLLLLGFKETPEQSESEQSEKEFGSEGKKRLKNIENQLEDFKIDFDTRLIFSNKIRDQIKEIINEEQLQFVLLLKSFSELEQLIVPLYDISQVNKQLGTILYNFQANTQYKTKLKIVLFTEEKDDSSAKNELRTTMEQQLSSFSIVNRQYSEVKLNKVSPKKIYKKLTNKTDLIIWSEGDKDTNNFFLDYILENNPEDGLPPSIFIMNSKIN